MPVELTDGCFCYRKSFRLLVVSSVNYLSEAITLGLSLFPYFWVLLHAPITCIFAL